MKQESLEEFIDKKEIKGPYELLEGWGYVRLGEIVTHIKSGFACSKRYEVEKGIPHLRPNNIGFNGELDLSKLVYIPEEMVDLTKYSLKKGDILFNNTNSKELVGRASLVKKNLNYGFSNHITRLRVNKNDKNFITPKWMVSAINYLWIQGYFLKICRKWIGQAGVNTKMLKSTLIPLPQLLEQKRIIARIEQLFNKLDEIKKLRKEALEESKDLMPSALHKVFSKVDEKSWKWVRLGEIVTYKTGIWGKVETETESKDFYPILRSTNIANWNLKLKDIAYRKVEIPSEKIREYILENGDLIITKSSGSTHLVGESAIFYKSPKDFKTYLFSNFTLRIRAKYEIIYPKFLHYYLMSPIGREKFEEMHRTTSGLRNLKTKAYFNQPIPLPPLSEQKRISTYLDKIQGKTQALQKLQEGTEKEAKKFRESILCKAFRGEL